MPIESESQTPQQANAEVEAVIEVSWDLFSSRVDQESRDDFAQWLDDSLFQMETRLKRFSSKNSLGEKRR